MPAGELPNGSRKEDWNVLGRLAPLQCRLIRKKGCATREWHVFLGNQCWCWLIDQELGFRRLFFFAVSPNFFYKFPLTLKQLREFPVDQLATSCVWGGKKSAFDESTTPTPFVLDKPVSCLQRYRLQSRFCQILMKFIYTMDKTCQLQTHIQVLNSKNIGRYCNLQTPYRFCRITTCRVTPPLGSK